MFFTNIFSYHSRTQLTEHAYRATLDDLRNRRDEIAPVLARHGIRLRDEILEDRHRTIAASLGEQPPRMTRPTAQIRRALDDLEHLLGLPAEEHEVPALAGPRGPTGLRRRT
jgi:hypothetical protein